MPTPLRIALALAPPSRPTLTLDHFHRRGLEFDALALIEAGAGASDTLYAAPPRGTVGRLLAGDLGLGPGNATITSIRRQQDGRRVVINDNDAALVMRDYFDSGGAGADLNFFVQTVDGVASSPVTARGNVGGDFVQLGPFGEDFEALFGAIAEGERFIVAFARESPAAQVTVIGIGVRLPAATAKAKARPVLLRIGLAPRAPAEAIKAHAAALAIALALAAPRRETRARPWALAVGLMLARAIARDNARPSALGIEIALAAPAFVNTATRYARTLRASAPAHALLTALEISHPAIAVPVRVVNDTRNRIIEGGEYVALRFEARLADDVDGRAPQAELAIDNVGRALTQWIEATGGGIGATARIMLVLDIDDAPVEWEVTLDVAAMAVDAERVTARLGFDPLLGRAAVTLRHDPQTSPGLF